ncbi:MAG: histidinol-phosphate aminotransferase [Chloroflexota bacterium]|nr:histidinol-phosphate aminotransferase [Chloroflexota bacterium]
MSRAEEFLRPMVREMAESEPILSLERMQAQYGFAPQDVIKLDANENPYGALPEVCEALGRLPSPQIYPDPECSLLRQKLAEYHDVEAERIVVGAGLDEVIDLIMRVCIDPGDVILNCPPTFGMYAFDGKLHGARMLDVPRKADFSLDMDGIRAAVQGEGAKLFILPNPNNPDGGVIDAQTFQQLLDLPLLLVMDEAYIQYYGEENSAMAEVAGRDNLVVLRTFSKWAGLAGLRIGYGVFPLEIAAAIMKIKQPYNVSVAAQTAAVVTMNNIEKTAPAIAAMREQRQILYEGLQAIEWLEPFPSQANFLLCRVQGRSAAAVAEELRGQGIMLRCFDQPGLPNALRISAGTAEQTQKLLGLLKEMR